VKAFIVAVLVAPFLLLAPIVFIGVTAAPAAASCVAGPTPAADGSPSILGPSTLTAAQIAAWWRSTNPGPATSSTIGVDVATLAAYYVDGGTADGVRGDIAFAQAILETGAFTSTDATQLNNFAGIGHPDGAAAGTPFPTVQAGVTAQVQLLKEVVLGNATTFAEPRVAPDWGGASGITTWAGLAGTWASAPDYWNPAMSSIYASMLAGTGVTVAPSPPPCVPGGPANLAAMFAFAEAQLGKPYLFGGTGPDAFDCSGLTMMAFRAAGISLPRTAGEQYVATAASAVPYSQARPGDLLFWSFTGNGADAHHVAIYLGNGQMLDAAHTGTVVRIEAVWTTLPDFLNIATRPGG
jgi:cell wall-associated NlpC family hydrolase